MNMNLEEIIKKLDLQIVTEMKSFSSIFPIGGYSSDLLSCVMTGAKHHTIWVTIQAHNNIVAVASLLELDAIIITEGSIPDQATIEKANSEGITILSSAKTTFEIIGQLWDLGIRSC
jgi:predicted transcriptional regulator